MTESLLDRLGVGMATVMREPDAARREHLLDVAYELGFRYFDTAPIYGFGTAEAEIGKLVERGATGLQVATKFGRDVTRGGSLIRKVQQPARRLVKALPGVRSVFRRTSGGVRSAEAPSLEEFLRNLDSSLTALRLESVDAYLAHEIAWSDGWTRLWEQLHSVNLPVGSIGLAGSYDLLESYPKAVVSTSEVMQLPLADAALDGDADVLYAAVSTLRAKFTARIAARPDLLEHWGVPVDTEDHSVTCLMVAAALRRVPQARILVGTTSVSHLNTLAAEVPEWTESKSVDWNAVDADLFGQEAGASA